MRFIYSPQEANKSQQFAHLWVSELTALLLRARVFAIAIALVLTASQSMATTQAIAPVNTTFAGWLDPNGTATADTVLQLANWEAFTGWKS